MKTKVQKMAMLMLLGVLVGSSAMICSFILTTFAFGISISALPPVL